ncbi:MAG: VOC family protein [Cyclobacteriaceae bacterium]
MNNTFPEEDMALTTILVVSDMEKSKQFYLNVLGAKIFRDYGGTSIVFEFLNSWILLVTAGGPTDDKPNVSFKPPRTKNEINHSFTIRVSDCQKSYEILKDRGAEFITPPYDWGPELRCFFPDPDGHLFEISQLK